MPSELLAVSYVVGAIILALIVHVLLSSGRRLSRRSRTRLDDELIMAVDRPLVLLIALTGVMLAVDNLALLGERTRVWVDNLAYVLYALLLLYMAVRLIDGIYRWYSEEVTHRTATDLDDKFLKLFRHTAVVITVTVGTVMVLGRFNVEVSALVTTLGIASLAVALAAQDTVHNMIAGSLIMLDRPFQEGDRIEILDISTWGDVQEIGLRTTRILTVDNRAVAIPNALIGNGLVVNHSQPDPAFRIQTSVGVAYGVDIERVRSILIEAIRSEGWVLDTRHNPLEALFMEFGDSSHNFVARCWIADYVDTRPYIDKMDTAVYKALNREQIEIPFPQRVLHLINSQSEQRPVR